MPLPGPSLAAQRQSLEPPLLQKEHASSSQKTVTSSASGMVSTLRMVPTGQPGGKAAMGQSRGSGRVEKLQLSPELLRPMTLLSVLASLDRSPDVSHPGARPEVDQLLSYSAPGTGSASGVLPRVVQEGGPCPACCASPGTDRGRGLEVVGAITARGSVIWSLRSCVGQFQRHSTLCFFPLQETMSHLHHGGVQGLWRSRPGVNLVFTNPGVPKLLEKSAVVQLQRSRSSQCLRKGRLREVGSL